MVGCGKDFLFCQSTLDFVAFDHLTFRKHYANHTCIEYPTMTYPIILHTFHSEEAITSFLFNHVDLANISFAKHSDFNKA